MKKKKCFVCMPLCDETLDLYNAIAKEIEETLGGQWRCIKADDISRLGMIEEKFVCDLLNADLVIAVITDPRPGNFINPNVMYELGIAHSFRKPTILIADANARLPFDIHSVETIQVNFSNLSALRKLLQKSLQGSLRDTQSFDGLEATRAHRNPVTTQLNGTKIFIEDLPWLWGYCEVFKREREAATVWEITRDLYWPGEALFFESLKEAIRKERKHYFMVENDPGVLRKVDAIRNELQREFSKNDVENLLHFVAIETSYFVLWPISVVLYDADRVSRKGGIICEPMQAQVGIDGYDAEIRRLFVQCAKSGDLDAFEKRLLEIEWTRRRQEATFDISLDGRVVDALATSFTQIWNKKVWEEAQAKEGDEKAALLSTWMIGRTSL